MTEESIFEIPARMAGAHCAGREQYDAMYKESLENPDAFWSKIAEQFTWKKKWDKVGQDRRARLLYF